MEANGLSLGYVMILKEFLGSGRLKKNEVRFFGILETLACILNGRKLEEMKGIWTEGII